MTERKFKEETLNQVFQAVMVMINEKMLFIPDDYSVENALRHAWFIIQDTKGGKAANYKMALDCCTTESVSNALLKMVTDGLNPAKHQCGFAIRKNGNVFNLDYFPEYQGNIALAKRYSGVKRVDAQVVYEGEEYKAFVKDGIKRVEHAPDMSLIDFKKIKGAYCVITEADGTKQTVEMAFHQIKQSWAQGAMNGEGDVHKNFTDQMCIKTTINRATKAYRNSSNDVAILPGGSRQNIGIELGEQNKSIASPEQPKLLSIEPEAKEDLKTEQPKPEKQNEEGPGY